MPFGWGGADPVVQGDSGDYELGTEQVANEDITITHVRVWADATEEGFVGRTATIWSTAEAVLATASLPDTLTPGWSTHAVNVPLARLAGQRWIVSYSTGGRYGALTNALGSGVLSPDGAVTTVASGSATNGNGVFNETPAQFPQDAFGTTFYGVDVVYTLGAGGTAPTITSVTLDDDGLDVVATIAATDPEGLTGATYRVEWGDGQISVGSTTAYSHTYAEPGLYAVLARVTDSTGRSDHHAAAIVLYDASPFNAKSIISMVASHAGRLGWFERVNEHELLNAPGLGLTCAVWCDDVRPVPARSGLDATSIRFAMFVRIYTSALMQPVDAIDPNVISAADALLAAYTADFTLEGLVSNVDLLGAHGVPLSGRAGYLTIDHKPMRVFTITLPLIINDIWSQDA